MYITGKHSKTYNEPWNDNQKKLQEMLTSIKFFNQ